VYIFKVRWNVVLWTCGEYLQCKSSTEIIKINQDLLINCHVYLDHVVVVFIQYQQLHNLDSVFSCSVTEWGNHWMRRLVVLLWASCSFVYQSTKTFESFFSSLCFLSSCSNIGAETVVINGSKVFCGCVTAVFECFFGILSRAVEFAFFLRKWAKQRNLGFFALFCGKCCYFLSVLVYVTLGQWTEPIMHSIHESQSAYLFWLPWHQFLFPV